MSFAYSDIIQRVVNELGYENLSAKQRGIIRVDIYDVMLKVFRLAEPLKATTDLTITSSDSNIELPQDFYAALEVIFFNSDNNKYFSKELTYDEFLRWQPDTTASTTSFSSLAEDTEPAVQLYSIENFDNDGYVGWTIPDMFDSNKRRYIEWKPAIAGSIKVYYLVIPTQLTSVVDEPKILTPFREILVHGAVLKGLRRLFRFAKSDVELIGLKTQYSEHVKEFEKMLAEYSGYVNRTVTTQRVEPFDFLNDFSMLVYPDGVI